MALAQNFFPPHSVVVVTIPQYFIEKDQSLIKISPSNVSTVISYAKRDTITWKEPTWYSDRTNWSNVNYTHEQLLISATSVRISRQMQQMRVHRREQACIPPFELKARIPELCIGV